MGLEPGKASGSGVGGGGTFGTPPSVGKSSRGGGPHGSSHHDVNQAILEKSRRELDHLRGM